MLNPTKMSPLNPLLRIVPYLYFIALTFVWYIALNKIIGTWAFLVFLLDIPFILQIVSPNSNKNFGLGITFVCLSCYLIFMFFFSKLGFMSLTPILEKVFLNSGALLILNLIMALWIMRNSMK